MSNEGYSGGGQSAAYAGTYHPNGSAFFESSKCPTFYKKTSNILGFFYDDNSIWVKHFEIGKHRIDTKSAYPSSFGGLGRGPLVFVFVFFFWELGDVCLLIGLHKEGCVNLNVHKKHVILVCHDTLQKWKHVQHTLILESIFTAGKICA